ncbi:isoaspartyl peptidase/L-asparaginase family protein [Profundibacterium mesophilum]|uniref:Isoaspartyl peptidase n=1 Tax=Profundibacterium mesophilum KAUST100406-0324 TaxID=1037889 RepID=A0A921NXP5_9RHOB|nr:isoaspartyl peptidase/L-asparaginase [Profundibacterium mesophilum]KAF0676644.1 Asparaginase [Profundibacterium mesophilum KAUST100406-0324]
MGYTLAIHGGAGVIPRDRLTCAREADVRAALDRALNAGEDVLSTGGSALDAVTAAVCALEDEPLFNAGRGAVFTREGCHEMDAAVMNGSDRRAGCVAGIFGPRNPVRLARCVMERTDHVLMIGEGALRLGREAGLEDAPAEYFFTQERYDTLQETLRMEAAGTLDDDPARRHGTVGAVARDLSGGLAAATSTGGMTAKRPGRVGDSPLIGAGTFADDRTCAISATGDGEAFIRLSVAHEIDARMRLAGETLSEAADHVVKVELARLNGSGGLVAVNAEGRVAAPFNCEGMYRGWTGDGLERSILIY